MTDDLSSGAPVPGDTAMSLVDAERSVRMHLPPGAPADLDERALAVLLAEYDRRGAALAYATELGGQAIRAEAQAVRDLEAENAQLRAALDTVDGPVLNGLHALALTGTVGHRLNCACTVIDWPRAALASGDTATPTDEQVADALRAWHDLTANQRATWDRLRPRWSLAAFIAHHLRAALAARAPQLAPDEETNDAR